MNNYMVDEGYNEGRIIDCSQCICYRCKLSTRGQQYNMANCHNCENCKRHSHFKTECDDISVQEVPMQEPIYEYEQMPQYPIQQGQPVIMVASVGLILLVLNIFLIHIWWLYIISVIMILSIGSAANNQQ